MKEVNYFLIIFLFFCLYLVALSPEISPIQTIQRSWTTKDGIPQISITDLQFDEKGYLWISTFGGVVRFNGQEFLPLNLPDPRATCLYLDNKNNLWIGTENGFIFKKQEDDIFSFSLPLKSTSIADLIVDFKNKIYVASNKGIWITEDIEQGKWENINVFKNPNCRKILLDGDNLFIGTHNGLYILKNGILKMEEDLKDYYITDIFKDKDGKIWVGTLNGLFLKDKEKWRAFPMPKEYSKSLISLIYQDKNNLFWFNLKGNAFGRWNPKKNVFTVFKPKGSGEWIYCSNIKEDLEGSLWFGTSGGLFQLCEGMASTYTGEKDELDLPIKAFLEIGKEEFLVIPWRCGGMYHYKENKVMPIEEFKSKCLLSIAKDKDKIWVGSLEGVFLRKGKGGKFIKQKFLLGANVLSFLPFKNHLYVGTEEGFYKVDENGKETLFEETKNIKIYTIKEKDGSFWLGTDNGIYIIKGDKVEIIGKKDGLEGLFVRALYFDKDGILWIGTYGNGLYRYSNGKIFSFDKVKELPKTIHFIAEDKFNKLWITSNQGIFCVEKSKLNEIAEGREVLLNLIWINEKDGMLSRECNGGSEPAGFLSEDGFLLVPTVRGIVKVSTEKITNYIPPVYIEEVLLDGKKINHKEGEIKVPKGAHLLEIKAISLSYLSPERCKYKSFLEGWDKDFVDMGTRNTAYYTNLPHGNYKFKIIADNGFGLWNTKGAELKIIVPTPFTKSIYFYILNLLLLSFSIFLIVNFYTYSLRKRKEKLEKIVEKQTSKIRSLSELAAKANSFSSLDELMDFFFINFKNVISYHFICLTIIKKNEKILKVIWAKYEEKESEFFKDLEVQIDEEIFNSETPVIINKIEDSSLFFEFLKQEGISSLLLCPLKVFEDLFGFIIFGSREENFFSKEDAQTFLDISNHLSPSIKKTYILEELQSVAGTSEKFYTMVIHDLKHPLNTINLYIDLLKDDLDKFDEEQKEYLKLMEKSAKEYNILLNDLLDLAVFRGNYLQMNKLKLDFFKFLEELIKDMEMRATKRGFYWECFIPKKEVEVSFDPKRIKQVLENFLSNALKYSTAGSNLTFWVEILEEEIKVCLKNEGFISEEKIKVIEDAFSTSFDPKIFISKAGIGLYISKSIIEAHNGKIGFEKADEGSYVFYFTIPL